jgi:glutathione S-transferase
MAKPMLVIGNKNYSSWSLRPSMMLAMAGIPFDEKLIRFGEPEFSIAVRKISAAARVPVLLHNGNTIWDSLAIMEYLAETFPRKLIWPKNKKARALARSASAEMHSSFVGIRNECPMNLRRQVKPPRGGISTTVQKEVARIESLWAQCRKAYGKGGPFLFGKFTAADAMFAPVVTRLETFAIPVKPETRRYMDSIMKTAAFQNWKTAALKEPWIVPEDEVD